MTETEDKTQQTTKLWAVTLKLLKRLQGLRQYEGFDESQAEIIHRLVSAEFERVEKEGIAKGRK